MSTLELIAVLATVWFIGLPLLIVGGILAWQADARRRASGPRVVDTDPRPGRRAALRSGDDW